MSNVQDADKFRAQLQQLFALLPDMQNTSTTLFERLQLLEAQRCEWTEERRRLLQKHECDLRSHMEASEHQKTLLESEIAQKAQNALILTQQLETAKREKADLEQHIAFQAKSFAKERIQIREAAVQEAERRASEAVQRVSKEYSMRLDGQAAQLASMQEQAAKCQLALAAKEAQLADLQDQLDRAGPLPERRHCTAQAASELQQALAAKDAKIAELDSNLQAAMSYRRKCVTLTQECKQLRAQLQSRGEQPSISDRPDTDPSPTSTGAPSGDSGQRQAAACERREATEHAQRDEMKIYMENLKRRMAKKCRLFQEMQATLAECKERMLAHGLDPPGSSSRLEEEQELEWDPSVSKVAAVLPQPHADTKACEGKAPEAGSSGDRTAFLPPADEAAPTDTPPTEVEASPDDVNCCTVVYKAPGPTKDGETGRDQPCSAAGTDAGPQAGHLEKKTGNNAPSPASPSSSPSRHKQQPPLQPSEQSDGQQKAKRAVAACGAAVECGGGSVPKRQRTDGVLRDTNLNTLPASQDSTEAMQTVNARPRDDDDAAEADISATQITTNARQRQPDRDSQENSENIDCTPQSKICPQQRAAPTLAAAEPAEPPPQEAVQDSAAPGSPAWQLKSREQHASAAAAQQRDVSLHLSQPPPVPREAASPATAPARPNPFNRPTQHARAAGALPPPKWNQKQRGPPLQDVLSFLDVRQTQHAPMRAPAQLPTIVERHSDAARAAAEPVPQRPKPDQPQQRPGERGYKYKETVRKKAEREELTGVECVDCKKFYAAVETWGGVGDMPACGHPVRGQQPGGAAAKSGSGAARPSREQLRQDASRHRYRYEPPATPAGFWDLGFMDSQDSRVQTQNYGRRREDEAGS